MNKEKKIIVKNYIALLFIQGANFILPLIILPYLVRVLGSEKFGLVMIAQSVAIFLTIIVDFGFNISATKEVASLKNDKEKLWALGEKGIKFENFQARMYTHANLFNHDVIGQVDYDNYGISGIEKFFDKDIHFMWLF